VAKIVNAYVAHTEREYRGSGIRNRVRRRCFDVAHAPSFLRVICSIPSFGIAEFVVSVCSSDTNKNTNKADGCRELLRVFSMYRENFSRKSGIEPIT
jgi:hypothetical protein